MYLSTARRQYLTTPEITYEQYAQQQLSVEHVDCDVFGVGSANATRQRATQT